MSKGDVFRKGVAVVQAHADASTSIGREGWGGFDRCNLSQLAMQLVQAHGGANTGSRTRGPSRCVSSCSSWRSDEDA